MNTPNDILISWLNDAYAMEKSMMQVLENHANDAKDYPHVASKDREHLEETKRHAELVRKCLEQIGGDVSSTKSAMGTVTGYFQGVSTGMAPDELVKNFLQDYASENFEIICYRALIEAARIAGRKELILTFEQILRDEENMKSWLERNLGQAIDNYMLQPTGA